MDKRKRNASKNENKLDDETLRWLLTLKELSDRVTDEKTRELLFSLVEMDRKFQTQQSHRAYKIGYAKGLEEGKKQAKTYYRSGPIPMPRLFFKSP